MKYIKLYESFENTESFEIIESICDHYNIYNYTINEDGTVDVDGNVNVSCDSLTELPLKFGEVSGNFFCNDNELTSLEGCPKSVGRIFNCSHNQLTSLEGCGSIGFYFSFRNNNLKNFRGFPEYFDGDFNYDNNPVSEILNLFNHITDTSLLKIIEYINEYDVIQGNNMILSRLEEVFYTLEISTHDFNFDNIILPHYIII